eukprot:7224-Heterococcus_DN1.PRE.1
MLNSSVCSEPAAVPPIQGLQAACIHQGTAEFVEILASNMHFNMLISPQHVDSNDVLRVAEQYPCYTRTDIATAISD